MEDNFDIQYVTIVRSGAHSFLDNHESTKKNPKKLHSKGPSDGLNLPAWV